MTTFRASEYPPTNLKQIPQMCYNSSKPLAQQQEQSLQVEEIDSSKLASKPQFYQPRQIDASFIFGTLEGKPTQPGVTTEIKWQQQIWVGNEMVFDYLKEDSKGHLRFFRARVSLNNNYYIKDAAVEEISSEPISAADTQVSVEATSPSPEAPIVAAVDTSEEISIRAAVGVGLAVNLLALAVGGYLLQVADSGNTEIKTAQAQKAEFTAHLPKNWHSTENIAAPENFQILAEHFADFAGAAIKQMPKDTAAYAKVQAKLREYSEKQRPIAAQAQSAASLPVAKEFLATTHHKAKGNYKELLQFPSLLPSSNPQNSLNPGDFLLETAPQSAIISFPEIRIDS